MTYKNKLTYMYLLVSAFTQEGGGVKPTSPIELTTSRTEELQARRSCASLLEIFTQPFHHRV